MSTNNDFDAKEHFGDKHATVYDEKIRRVIRGYDEMHDLSYYLLKDNLPSKASILVSGLGTGHEAIKYASNQDDWYITGVDPTPEMLQSAQQRIKQQGLADRIETIEGTPETMSKTNFDAASSILVMQFLKDNGDKEKYLRNIASRLKKRAKFIIIDLEGNRDSQDFKTLLSAWKCHQFSTRDDQEQIVKDFNHVEADLQFISGERIKELLEAAGFTKICKFYQSYLFGGYIAEKA